MSRGGAVYYLTYDHGISPIAHSVWRMTLRRIALLGALALFSLAFARMPRVAARGGMATGDRGVARRAKTGGFGAVPLGFATDAPRGSAGSFTHWHFLMFRNQVNGPARLVNSYHVLRNARPRTSQGKLLFLSGPFCIFRFNL